MKDKELKNVILKIEAEIIKNDSMYSELSGGVMICKECSTPASILIPEERNVLCIRHNERRRTLLAHRDWLIKFRNRNNPISNGEK